MKYCFLIITDRYSYPYLGERKKLSIKDIILIKDSNDPTFSVNIYSIKNIISLGRCTEEEFELIRSKYYIDPQKGVGNITYYKYETYHLIQFKENSCDECDLKELKQTEKDICKKFNSINAGNCTAKGYKKL